MASQAASITASPLQHLPRAFFLLLVSVQAINGLALPTSIPEQSSSCPVQDLTTILGSSRHHLQHFTPDFLCSSPASATQINADSSAPATQTRLSETEFSEWYQPSVNVVGCSSKELSALAFADMSTTQCHFHMTCQYDPDRYPAVLYKAVRSSEQSASCPDDQACLPVTKDILLLRRSLVVEDGVSCSVWQPRMESVTRGYRCQELHMNMPN